MNIELKSPSSTLLLSLCFASLLMFSNTTAGQTPVPDSAKPQPTPTPSLEHHFFHNILRDQRDIWMSPFHLQRSDVKWVAPLGLSTAILLATDRHTSGELVENGESPNRLRISKDVSQLGSAYFTGGVAAAFYLTGRASNNARARETGLLSAEALIDSYIVSGALKLASQRQRPPVDHTSGEFFDGGSSFPSGHAISAWTLATVIDQEYGSHRPLVRFGAYGVATAVSLSRFTGRNHFLSDVLVGSAMGYGIGRYVFRQHHDSSLDSSKKKRTSRLSPMNLFGHVVPIYNPRAGICGASMAWSF